MAKHSKMPPEFRERYKRFAYQVYSDIEGDISQCEGDNGKPIKYSLKTWVEIIRDANRIRTWAENDRSRFGPWHRIGPQTKDQYDQGLLDLEFLEWLKINEYSDEFRADMNKAVREVL